MTQRACKSRGLKWEMAGMQSGAHLDLEVVCPLLDQRGVLIVFCTADNQVRLLSGARVLVAVGSPIPLVPPPPPRGRRVPILSRNIDMQGPVPVRLRVAANKYGCTTVRGDGQEDWTCVCTVRWFVWRKPGL